MAPGDATVTAQAQVLWNFHRTETALRGADVIVGLGSYDLRVADRCAELWHAGFAPRILFSGSSGNWTRDTYAGSEADAFAGRAISLGVPARAITLEERATNIGENIAFSRIMITGATSAIWVTKPQTLRRVAATLSVQWPDLTSMLSAPQHGLSDQPTDGHPVEALLSEMVGDLWRLTAYATRGYSSPQPIPAAVRSAFDALVRAGYIDHLPNGVCSLDPS